MKNYSVRFRQLHTRKKYSVRFRKLHTGGTIE